MASSVDFPRLPVCRRRTPAASLLQGTLYIHALTMTIMMQHSVARGRKSLWYLSSAAWQLQRPHLTLRRSYRAARNWLYKCRLKANGAPQSPPLCANPIPWNCSSTSGRQLWGCFHLLTSQKNQPRLKLALVMGSWGCCEAGDVAYSMYLVDDDPQYICSLYHIKPFVDVTYEMYIKRKFDPALDLPSILLLLWTQNLLSMSWLFKCVETRVSVKLSIMHRL